jgi:hypothetical protein
VHGIGETSAFRVQLYLLLLFIRVLLSWFPNFSWENQPWLALRQVTANMLHSHFFAQHGSTCAALSHVVRHAIVCMVGRFLEACVLPCYMFWSADPSQFVR